MFVSKHQVMQKIVELARQSIKDKIDAGWSRENGAGFVSADITSVELSETHSNYPFIKISFEGWGSDEFHDCHLLAINDEHVLNLRETEELLAYLEELVSPASSTWEVGTECGEVFFVKASGIAHAKATAWDTIRHDGLSEIKYIKPIAERQI